MKSTKFLKLVFTSLVTAIIIICTLLIKIPLPASAGYVNISDAFGISASFILGPLYGAIALALGGLLSDLLLGFAYYAPTTFIVKFLSVIIPYIIVKNTVKNRVVKIILYSIIFSILMPFGYLCFEYFILKLGSASLFSFGCNIAQGIISGIASIFIISALEKTNLIKGLKYNE